MDVLWLVFFALLGACVGSFLNVVIWRMPRGESIVFPGSHCPSCGRPIRWFDNIPIISYLLLQGRCRRCHVRISPRYMFIEGLTALLVAGLYACYYFWHVRQGLGDFPHSWLTYVAHTTLLCGLLACSAVDLEHWIVPLEICWFVSVVGIAAAAIQPPSSQLLPSVHPVIGAMAVAATIGLGISVLLLRWGFIRPSFIDADDKASFAEESPNGDPSIVSVAATKSHGVNPRVEMLHELVYLAPAVLLAIGAWVLVYVSAPVREGLLWLHDADAAGRLAAHLGGFEAALVGYLVGGLWIWGTRILATLAVGKEAMGLGDVHLLAAVGAVTGWITPTLAFFVAPILGLAVAIRLRVSRRQKELPYGPWLAAGTVVVLIFYDTFISAFSPYQN